MDQAEGDYMRKIAKKQAIKVNLKELVLVSTTLKVAELSKVKKISNNYEISHISRWFSKKRQIIHQNSLFQKGFQNGAS